MFKNLKKQQEGFTIIEVMIVLVIAAVILLIVFLAVPALQRNSRNTQRKNDVAGALSAVNEWANNNGGKFPITPSDKADALKNVKLGFYDPAQVTFVAGASTSNTTTTETLQINTNAACAADGKTAVATSRTVAALYTVETGGNPQAICQSS